MRPVRALLAAATVAAGCVAAGCTEADTSPVDGSLPSASAEVPTASAAVPTVTTPSTQASRHSRPPVGRHWSGLAAKCPRLTGAAARGLGVSGDGSPTGQYATSAAVTNADCRWGSSDGRGNAVTARISIWENLEAADAQWATLSAGQSTPLDVGDEGFIADEPGAVVVRTHAGNAVATIRLVPATGTTGTDALRQAAPEITNDVLDDLVPA